MADNIGLKTRKDRERAQADIAEQDANARLIAAAPDLLQALKDILEHVEDDSVDRRGGSQCTLCHTYRMIGHRAIAKAEGRDV